MVNEIEVKKAFNTSTERFHLIACWVGIILNLLWTVNDIFEVPHMWKNFFAFRVAVCVVALCVLLLRKKLNASIYFCMFLLVFGISIQNAYMWSVMTPAEFQKHTLAYLALFICCGMLVLWKTTLSLILIAGSLIANFVFQKLFGKVNTEEFFLNGGLLVLTVGIALIFLIRQRYRLTYSEIRSRLELEASAKIIEKQKKEVEEKNEEITSSLRYAKRLQEAILPPDQLINSVFNEDYFIYYLPRDIVSGDFYWMQNLVVKNEKNEEIEYSFFAVADCTGHGVPGAFMSLLGSNFLNQSLADKKIKSTSEVLDFLNQHIIYTLNKGMGEEIRDGMDISLICINNSTKELSYSGANNPIYIISEGNFKLLKADKQAIGNISDEVKPFSTQTISLNANDCIYLTTDGYIDQFGGEKGKKLMRRNFENLIMDIYQKPMKEQFVDVQSYFVNWLGNYEQIDDVCVIGLRL